MTPHTDSFLDPRPPATPCIFKGRCGRVTVTLNLDVIDRLSLGPLRPERSVGRHVLDSPSPHSCLVPWSPYLQGRADRRS